MSSSDTDEGPEQLSFKTAKTVVEQEQQLVNLQKANEKQHAKLKRKLKQELFLRQKAEKIARLEEAQQSLASSILDELRAESALQDKLPPTQSLPQNTVPEVDKNPKKNRNRKMYKDLNIEVTRISDLRTDRFSNAASFRNKRLAKVPRESVTMNLIHAEKLSASGK